jgi:hypothetical protein
VRRDCARRALARAPRLQLDEDCAKGQQDRERIERHRPLWVGGCDVAGHPPEFQEQSNDQVIKGLAGVAGSQGSDFHPLFASDRRFIGDLLHNSFESTRLLEGSEGRTDLVLETRQSARLLEGLKKLTIPASDFGEAPGVLKGLKNFSVAPADLREASSVLKSLEDLPVAPSDLREATSILKNLEDLPVAPSDLREATSVLKILERLGVAAADLGEATSVADSTERIVDLAFSCSIVIRGRGQACSIGVRFRRPPSPFFAGLQ